QNQNQPWMRWWDSQGNLLLLGEERAFRAEQAQRAAVPRLLALGLTTEQVAQTLSLTVEEVQQYSQRSPLA
ncbi:MAG: Uma2 family endonuclease, partial [Hormoscilla sp. SP5CHS1]|nr:Uma2 family endonuclease [Hormoscilla sp. SP12CHS1]MBC6454542.1 Uma2 family endonuclease [Hormoscilla sp. SP5CHS1]